MRSINSVHQIEDNWKEKIKKYYSFTHNNQDNKYIWVHYFKVVVIWDKDMKRDYPIAGFVVKNYKNKKWSFNFAKMYKDE
jgi:hypothetical protein